MLASGGLALPPREPAPGYTQKLFEELGKQYVIKEDVITYLVQEVGCAGLYDFCKLFAGAKDIGKLMKKVGLEEKDVPLQTARLWRAWEAVVETAAAVAKMADRRVDDATRDAPQAKPGLDEARKQYWQQRSPDLPIEAAPSDQSLSGALRESSTSLLTIRPVERAGWVEPARTTAINLVFKGSGPCWKAPAKRERSIR